MRFKTVSFTFLAMVVLSGFTRAVPPDGDPLPPPGPVRIATAEAGVVPAGTWLVVRTSDTVSADRAGRDTIYDGSLAEDVVDQNGRILVPKESPVELGVFSFGFLGPGGAGMSELALGLRAVTVNGMSYPVETAEPQRDGGLGSTDHTAKWVGGAPAGKVLTRGRRINVPEGTLLSFQTEGPIRLRGYRR
jgi:hypothetical protein